MTGLNCASTLPPGSPVEEFDHRHHAPVPIATRMTRSMSILRCLKLTYSPMRKPAQCILTELSTRTDSAVKLQIAEELTHSPRRR